MRIEFLGGTGTVTGSKYLLEHDGRRLLVDCGLFQGLTRLRLRNWDALPIKAPEVDAVLLTHAHMDHSGFVPRLVKLGFKEPVYCTEATRDLCALLLPDSGGCRRRRRPTSPTGMVTPSTSRRCRCTPSRMRAPR